MNKWYAHQSSWDAQQDVYRPDRESGLRAMCEVVARGCVKQAPRILDLACGCGSVTARLLKRLPSAQVVGIDRDPVLLRIAKEIWTDDPRVTIVQADLRDIAWRGRPEIGQFDAVVTAASLHWFEPEDLEALYRAIASCLSPGGLFANLDWIQIAKAPALQGLSDSYVRAREDTILAEDGGHHSSWSEWWAQVLADPDLTAEAAERSAMDVPRSAEHMADEDWHRSELSAAGFDEVGVVWRSFSSAVIVARREDRPGPKSRE